MAAPVREKACRLIKEWGMPAAGCKGSRESNVPAAWKVLLVVDIVVLAVLTGWLTPQLLGW
eukprot:CAMPEP_0170616652 /NCGR_PEP_ID=MMETSP0224-20130122/25982_1 /TAXON_ID=285029 /ORGANISM="Togula jolla, Strain CCCM 725" /LENGTH=60 /DNA_ID=CAMNT_0010942459 /DNA_START=618 /DNA_END=800 /DNA_ORIENTATION=+